MKTYFHTVLPVTLAVLVIVDFAFHGVVGSVAAQALWPGRQVQSQSPDTELARQSKAEIAKAVARGEALWKGRQLGLTGQSCTTCHTQGADVHPETFPKFKPKMGRVVTVQEGINWCIVATMRGDRLEVGGADLTALEAYLRHDGRRSSLVATAHTP